MASTTTTPGTGTAAPMTAWTGVVRQFDYWAAVVRRTWRGTFISSFLAPLLYVVAMGVLLGGFIDADPATMEGATSYLAFIVPGLVATHAMQIAVEETTYPVMGALKWQKVYYAQQATPLRIVDLVNGHLAFVLYRVASASAVFMLVLAPFGVFESWWGPFVAGVSQVLVGMAFGTVVYAIATRATSDQVFAVIFRLGVIPLTLFSGAFFPISNLGPVLEWVARLTPLWHGVNLSRMFSLDHVDWAVAGVNLAVLLVVIALGWRFAVTGLTKRMEV